MLILTRRIGENVVVGDDVVISVLEVRGDAVRLGIQAPRSVTVHREEVYRELQRANQQAAQSAGATDDALAAAARQWRPPVESGQRRGSPSESPAGDGSDLM